MADLNELWEDYAKSSLMSIREKGLQRILRPVNATSNAVQVEVPGNVYRQWLGEWKVSHLVNLPGDQSVELKLFSLNDYLGLSTHPQVRLAATQAASCCGMGPRSSALVGGYTSYHRDLELELAQLKETEDCLLFPTGFAANQATMAVLGASPDCVIFSDELNHASIIDGIRLAKSSGAKLKVYRHNDMSHLSTLLESTPRNLRKLVVTDSLFSMDGDFADLTSLAALRRQHGFLLAIDEAHATLVCGERGGGAADMFGVSDEVDVHIGTLSKAVGSQGGFVACRRDIKSLISNRGRPYIFSTATAIPSVAGALAALRVSHEESWRRRHVWSLVKRISDHLGVGFQSPIIPVILGSEERTLSAAGRLLAHGLHVPPIRPPTVKPGTCRLRISLSAAHSTEDVDNLVKAIHDCHVPAEQQSLVSKL